MARFAVLVAMTVLIGICGCGERALPPGAPPPPPARTGSVEGVVRFEGTPPPPKALDMSARAECHGLYAKPVQAQAVEVSGGKLAGALVYVRSGLERFAFPPPAEPVVLDQVGCLFVPRLFGVMAGQLVRIKNSDEAMHNVHTFPVENGIYNRGFPSKGSSGELRFDVAEGIVPIRCDMHTWMTAHAGVFAHPFHGVTGAGGAFAFSGVPAGPVELEVWHESLPPLRRTVTVSAGGSVQVELVLR